MPLMKINEDLEEAEAPTVPATSDNEAMVSHAVESAKPRAKEEKVDKKKKTNTFSGKGKSDKKRDNKHSGKDKSDKWLEE